jgi:2-keto-4-pentenoate hydratase
MLVAPRLLPVVERLIAAYDTATMLPPITSTEPGFSVPEAYAVLGEIERRRRVQGWEPVGRKIGFTNWTIWARYGVSEPIWAHMWAHTVHHARGGSASLALRTFVQPRIEPEVVVKLKAPIPLTDDAASIVSAIEWIAPGFEIVQSHFPDWKFSGADCAAAFGLHGALVIGSPVAITDANRAAITAALPTFALTLSRNGVVTGCGVGSNVLGSPLAALAHLARVLADQPDVATLRAGEIITTGTITDAWPVLPGEVWSSDYGTLGLDGLELRFSAEP